MEVPLKTVPGHQCYWRVKPGSEYYYSGDVMPIFNYYVGGGQKECGVAVSGSGGYRLVYGFPSMEYPGLVKVGCILVASVCVIVLGKGPQG